MNPQAQGHRYQARIAWRRGDARFSDNRYSRGHSWSFDGGVTVPASSSPASVPPPYSIAAAVDPEEALVAAAASCHMLWFLSIAARHGFVVDEYVDEPLGVMQPNARGKLAFSRITLRPAIRFSDERLPSAAELSTLHESAHDECFIASSLNCEISVEGR